MDNNIDQQLDRWTGMATLIFQIIEQSDGLMSAYIAGQLSSLSDYAKGISDVKMKQEEMQEKINKKIK